MVRYLIVGGLVYVFELWIIVWAQHHGATPTEAVALSFTLGLIVSFFLQKLFTFGDKRMHHKIVLRQAFAVGLLVVWNLCFTVIITKAVQSFMPATIARTIALLITTIWNFYLYKTRIFTPHSPVIRVEKPSVLLGIKSATSIRVVSKPCRHILYERTNQNVLVWSSYVYALDFLQHLCRRLRSCDLSKMVPQSQRLRK